MKWPPSPGGSHNWAGGAPRAPKELQRRRDAETTPQEPSDRSTKTVEGKHIRASNFQHVRIFDIRIFNMFEFSTCSNFVTSARRVGFTYVQYMFWCTGQGHKISCCACVRCVLELCWGVVPICLGLFRYVPNMFFLGRFEDYSGIHKYV